MPKRASLLDGEWLSGRVSRTTREGLFALITLAAIVATFTRPPVQQNLAYNHFADARSLLGIPYFLDVVSNLPFLIVGLAGLDFLRRTDNPRFRIAFADPSEAWPYRILFVGVALASFGSSYYHFAPSDNRLVWDRLPMTIIFMSWLAATMGERIDRSTGLRLLPLLVGLGIYSIVDWHVSELRGSGDLRMYIDVQYLSILAIPLLGILFPSRYTRSKTVFVVGAVYLASKSFELLDAQIYALGHIVSGHTLKHLTAAAASYLILDMLRKRGLAPHSRAMA
ncbi:MAG TPA: hypothetical protein VI729_12730 [Anaerolineales bacterium]|nr:hypothetical protein [Anaerolineales bacterium]